MVLKPSNARNTCFMTVYGQSNPTVDASLEPWHNFSLDLQETLSKAPPKTDMVVMGDINERIGRTQNDIEASVIGKHGESNKKKKCRWMTR